MKHSIKVVLMNKPSEQAVNDFHRTFYEIIVKKYINKRKRNAA